MSRPIGLPKTGGRTKGTPNKRTLEFRAILEEAGFSIPRKALELYAKAEERNDLDLTFKILDFMAAYVHSKFKNVDDDAEEGTTAQLMDIDQLKAMSAAMWKFENPDRVDMYPAQEMERICQSIALRQEIGTCKVCVAKNPQ